MSRKRVFSPPSERLPWEPKGKGREKQYTAPWTEAVIKALRQGNGTLVLVNSKSDSDNDRRHIDDQLVQIAGIQSQINSLMFSGKEIGALNDLVGFPPYTFSEANSFYRGAAVSLFQSWDEEGMKTLVPDISVYTPVDDGERREAVLYGIGDPEDLSSLETTFCEYFKPSRFAKCFSDAVYEEEGIARAARFFVQWELFQDEAAQALGVEEDSIEFNAVLDQLEHEYEIRKGPVKRCNDNASLPIGRKHW